MLNVVIARVRVLMFLSVLCLSACSDSDGGDKGETLAELGVDDGASRGESRTAKVKAESEVVLKLSTGAEVKIPRGALEDDEELEVSLKRPPDSEALALIKRLPSTQKIASAPYVVTPHGTKFKREVTVTLPIAKDRDPKKLKVSWLKDEKDTAWKKIAVPETSGNKARFTVTHFSVLMLVEDDEPFEDEQPGTDDAGMGDTDGGVDEEDPDAGVPAMAEVTAHVRVLLTPEDAVFEGGLTLSVNGTAWNVDGLEGSATFPRNPEQDRYVVQLQQVPQGFTCTLARQGEYSAAQLLDIEVHCTRTAVPSPTLKATVRDALTGQAIEGALASVVLPADWSATAVAAPDGSLVLEVPESGRTLVRLDHPEYATQYVEVPTPADERALRSTWFMNAPSVTAEFDATEPYVVTAYDNDASVSIDANSLVDQAGQPYAGLAVARVTPIFARDDLANVPGELATLEQGVERPLELFSALDVRFETPAGDPLSLAPEKSVTVRMPSARGYYSYWSGGPQQAPLYYFDSSAGRWVEEGSAEHSYETLSYEAQLTRPGLWSVARVLDTVVYQSCVVDHAGNPLANALVEARGDSYLGVTRARADASGTFRLPVGLYASVRVIPRLPFEGAERFLSTAEEDFGTNACLVVKQGSLRITLDWGPDESDLDLHFFGEQAHIYYSNQHARIGDAIVSLVRDAWGAGPEVIISDLLPAGRYRVVAHAYRGGFHVVSPARVRIRVADIDAEWAASDVPEEADAWVVADLVFDGAGNVSVSPINLFTDSRAVTFDCPDMDASEPLACETFECADQSATLMRSAYCDGSLDCEDGSDENNADCPTSAFLCTTGGMWISGEEVCDGVESCTDGADEASCEGLLFDCGDGEHIKVSRVCDQRRDCSNGADEADCGWPSFGCGDGEQVPILFYCDGYPDCSDYADEYYCAYSE